MSPTNLERDLEFTKLKLEMGAKFLITQLFFDNRFFYSFMDRARKAGIEAPVLAGILPILNTQQIRRFTTLCGSSIPPSIDAKLDRLADDKDATRELGIEIATEQVRELLDWGVDGVHFYALNRSYSISKILTNLGFPQNCSSRGIGRRGLGIETTRRRTFPSSSCKGKK